MLRFTLSEYGTLPRDRVPPQLLRRLHRFDEEQAKLNDGQLIFDWCRIQQIRAKHFVGVIQIEGLQIEILPKISAVDDEALARGNLLVMLSHCRDIPFEERDLAQLHSVRHPLIDCLAQLFLQRLIKALHQGIDHQYVEQRDQLPYLRGKLEIGEHLRRNTFRQERFACRFDEFNEDSWLNRILKAACRVLERRSRNTQDRHLLNECRRLLDPVTDCQIHAADFDRVQLHRNNQRFDHLLTFARMILLGNSPLPESGGEKSFSLLFPMHQVFEEFIGHFCLRQAALLGLEPGQIHLQARKVLRHLLRDEADCGHFRLKPDLSITAADNKDQVTAILDTKWKQLTDEGKRGINQADMYQLYAYAQNYECSRVIALYPQTSGVCSVVFILESHRERQIRIEMLDLSIDLRSSEGKTKLTRRLREILRGE